MLKKSEVLPRKKGYRRGERGKKERVMTFILFTSFLALQGFNSGGKTSRRSRAKKPLPHNAKHFKFQASEK